MLEFQIKGMNCGHCVRAVTRAVHSIDPAATVAIDLASGRARIETAQPSDQIAARIREEGYAVSTA